MAQNIAKQTNIELPADTTTQDQTAIAEQNSNVYRWQDIEASALTLPAYTEEALRQIIFQLGYLPKRQITLPHEPFIRQALFQYDQDLDFDKLCDTCHPHIEEIYQKNMEPHKVVKYDAEVYAAYETYLPEYKDQAKARIGKFLGYEPKLDHSIIGELKMRAAFANDAIYLGDEKTEVDFEALTIIEYRLIY